MLRKKLIFSGLPAVLIVSTIALFYVATRGPTASKPKTNLLLITLDTTRTDRLGCYGYKKPTSPVLDGLAAESVQFDLAIAQAAVTPVSHASILTGLNPHHHGLRVMHGLVANRLPDEQQTLAEIWQELGGRTAAFVSAFPVTAAFGLNQGFEHFDDQFPQADIKNLVTKNGMVNTGISQRRADDTTKAAIEWLDKNTDTDAPLFMWVHYFDPHDPYLLPPKTVLDRFRPVSQKKPDVLRAIYDSEVFYMDSCIGQLLAAFKEQGLWDNTIIAVVADHGEGLGDHDWWTHGISYQEQIRVPLIIRVPGMKAGVRVSSLVRTIDLMPTVLAAAEVFPNVWPSMDGTSLLQAMQTGRTAEQRFAYSESVNMLTYIRLDVADKHDRKNDKLYCLMNETFKLIYHQLKPAQTEFYNLASDPGEMNNLAGSKPPAMSALMDRLKSLNAFSDIIPGMTPSDAEMVKRLKDLGYVQ